jgi:hypothetical protein
MSERSHKGRSESPQPAAVEATDPLLVPHATDPRRALGPGRFDRVQQERADAAAQIDRTVRVWRKAQDSGPAEIKAPLGPSTVARMPAVGNVADTGIMEEAQALVDGGQAPSLEDALAMLMQQAKAAKDKARQQKIKATQKAIGSRGSRHNKGGKGK